MSASGMQRIGALTLSNSADGGLYSSAIDPANGYAYFGGKHGWVAKVDVKGPLPVEVGSVQLPSGQPVTALVDPAAGYGYFITSKIDRIALGAGDDPPTYVDTLPLSGFAFAAVIDTSDPDPANHYLYVNCQGTPNRISKISVASFAEIGAVTLDADETSFRRGIIDTAKGYAYFVGPVAETAAPSVVKIALGAGSNPPTRIGAVQLDPVSHGMGSAVIDAAHGYGYFGTYYGPNSVPAIVYKVALGEGDAVPTLVGHVTLSAGTGAENGPDAAERELCSAVVDPASGYAYFGTDHTYPAKIFQIRLGDGDAAPVETGVLQLSGGTSPIGEPDGPNDGENVINSPSSLYGEVFLQSAVFDPVRGYAYFGTDGYPGKIVKVLVPTSTPEGGCGDGVVEAGEECDDGAANGQAGDCCASDCSFVSAGTQCSDDGNPCTSDVCNASGACTHSMPPSEGCQPAMPGMSTVKLKRGFTSATDLLAWTWVSSEGVAEGDLGDPLHTSDYTLCIADSAGGTLRLLVRPSVAAGGSCGAAPCWHARTRGGYKFSDPTLNSEGLSTLALRTGIAGKGRMKTLGQGPALQMPELGLTPPVIVRLKRDDATACWESTFSTPIRNDSVKFRAKSD